MMDHAHTLDDVQPSQANPSGSASLKDTVLRYIDWIWNIRGSVPIAPAQTSDEAFARLDPLFQQYGTTYERSGDALSFTKKDQAAQDKMSIFDAGVLLIENGVSGPVMRYRMASRALLFCFLMPLFFLAFGQVIVGIGKLEGAQTEKSEKAKKDDTKDKVLPQNPIDKALGAPAPEKPKKDDKKKDDKHSPTTAYVFAAIFAVLYGVGRVLEDRLVRSLFLKKLSGQ